MPGSKRVMDSQEMFWLSVMAGNALLHEGTPEKINYEMVLAALDPYRALDEQELSKRYFHVPGHAEGIAERIDARMHNVHSYVKQYINANKSECQKKPFAEMARELGQVYVDALQSCIDKGMRAQPDQERIDLADTDHAALWHDTVYHSDVQVPRSVEPLLCKRFLKRNGDHYEWTEEGKQSFSYQLLNRLDPEGKEAFLGPFPARPLILKYNEILSAVLCESAIREMGISDPQYIIGQVAVIVNTIPFRSPEYQQHFEQCVGELCQENPGSGKIVNSGKTFTNLADVADFGIEMKPGNLNILVGLTQIDRELMPVLRDRAAITGMDKATIDRSPFLGKFLAPSVASGKREIFRGDGTADSELAQLRTRGHTNAMHQLKAGCLLEDARVVAGFLTDAVMHEAGIKSRVPQSAITHAGQVVELFKCSSAVADYAQMDSAAREMTDIVCDVLAHPNNTKRLNGVEVEYGMPGDEYAAGLIKAVGPEKVSRMADRIYRVVSHRDKGTTAHEAIADAEKQLMQSFGNLLGIAEFRSMKKTLAQSISQSVQHPEKVDYAIAAMMKRYIDNPEISGGSYAALATRSGMTTFHNR